MQRGPHTAWRTLRERLHPTACAGALCQAEAGQVAGTQEAALIERVCVAPRLSPVRLACAIKTQFVIQSLAEKQLDIKVCLVSFSFSSTIPISLTFCCSAGITPAQSIQCTHKSSAQALQSHRSTHRSTAWCQHLETLVLTSKLSLLHLLLYHYALVNKVLPALSCPLFRPYLRPICLSPSAIWPLCPFSAPRKQ